LFPLAAGAPKVIDNHFPLPYYFKDKLCAHFNEELLAEKSATIQLPVIPAPYQVRDNCNNCFWIPASAGMTRLET